MHSSTTPINDGGPAFPCEGGDNSGLHAHPGMSLRCWLASQASNEDVLAHMEFHMCPSISGRKVYTGSREEAKYRYADAMLKAREVRP